MEILRDGLYSTWMLISQLGSQCRTSKFPSLGIRVLFLPSMPEVPIITLTPTQNQVYEAVRYNKRYLNPDWMSWEDKELHRLIKLWT